MARPTEQDESATARMRAARRHRARAYAERNELIGVLARLYPSCRMPVQGALSTVNDGAPEARRQVVCIETPVGKLYWVVSEDEVDGYFKPIKWKQKNDWDGSTRADRSACLAKLTALPTPIPGGKKRRAARVTPRRPGDFSKPRRAINR